MVKRTLNSSNSKKKIIAQGAEAIIIKNKKTIIKERIKKSYRIPELDEKIRKTRTKAEKKLLLKASEIISVPNLIQDTNFLYEMTMDFIDGKKLSTSLDDFPKTKQLEICEKIGNSVGKLHSQEIIHGDLTTSNMILKNNKIYFIDFGLGYISSKYEDQAVDIHLLRQALEAKHFKYWKELFEKVLNGYKIYKDHKIVIERLKIVEKRGRYKH